MGLKTKTENNFKADVEKKPVKVDQNNVKVIWCVWILSLNKVFFHLMGLNWHKSDNRGFNLNPLKQRFNGFAYRHDWM